MTSLADLFKSFKKEIKKSTGTDYTGIVTRVEGSTAYVQLTGSSITDTPCGISVDCKPGDSVRVRVNGGRAWVYGNDTAPPTNDTEKIKRLDQSNEDVLKRIKKVEGGVQIEGIVRFKDLENPEEETVIKGGNIDATNITIKDSYSMYNTHSTQKVMALNWTEPVPDFGYPVLAIDPDDQIPVCYINTDTTWVKALSGAVDGANFVFDGELCYVDMPVYNSNYEIVPGQVIRALQISPTYDGAHVNLASPAVYSRTAGGSANVGVNQYGTIYRISSSRRYKHDIKDLTLEEARKLLAIKPRTFKYNDDFLEQSDEKAGKDVPGFISEEVEEQMPIAVDHDNEGNAEMWNATILIPCMLKIIQDQERRIAELEARIKESK